MIHAGESGTKKNWRLIVSVGASRVFSCGVGLEDFGLIISGMRGVGHFSWVDWTPRGLVFEARGTTHDGLSLTACREDNHKLAGRGLPGRELAGRELAGFGRRFLKYAFHQLRFHVRLTRRAAEALDFELPVS